MSRGRTGGSERTLGRSLDSEGHRSIAPLGATVLEVGKAEYAEGSN
jgi:hypothetical protein